MDRRILIPWAFAAAMLFPAAAGAQLPPSKAAPKVGEKMPDFTLPDTRDNPGDLQNRKLLQDLTQSVTLPVYVVLSPEGKMLSVFQGSTRDEDEFVRFLKEGASKSKNLAMR